MDTLQLEESMEDVIKMDVHRSFPDMKDFDSAVFAADPEPEAVAAKHRLRVQRDSLVLPGHELPHGLLFGRPAR